MNALYGGIREPQFESGPGSQPEPLSKLAALCFNKPLFPAIQTAAPLSRERIRAIPRNFEWLMGRPERVRRNGVMHESQQTSRYRYMQRASVDRTIPSPVLPAFLLNGLLAVGVQLFIFRRLFQKQIKA